MTVPKCVTLRVWSCAGSDKDSEQTQAFFELAQKVATLTAFAELTAALDSLDDHLGYRTFLVGHDISATDIMVWGALKGACARLLPCHEHSKHSACTGSVKVLGLLKSNRHTHLNRWLTHVESLESTQLALASLIGKKLGALINSTRD